MTTINTVGPAESWRLVVNDENNSAVSVLHSGGITRSIYSIHEFATEEELQAYAAAQGLTIPKQES